MRYSLPALAAAILASTGMQTDVQARGFGAVRGGAVVGPRGGVEVGGSRTVGGVGYGGAYAGGSRGGTYVGPRGTIVQAERAGGVAVGPYGGVQAGGAEGIRVTTPNGRTVSTGSRGGVSVGPAGGVRAHGASGTALVGPYGSAAVGYGGGVAVGPYGGVSAGMRTVTVSHSTRYVSPTWRTSQATIVRGGYYSGAFTTGWYRTQPVAWQPARWRVPTFWVAPVWPALSLYCGISAPPISYDYGGTTIIENNTVYVNGDQVGSAEQYAGQAVDLARVGREAKPAQTDEWQPLGVFGMIQGEEKVAQHIFQLAINQAGVVRGNYYNAVADQTTPVQGALDKKTQRVAWSIGEKKNMTFETGLKNLTQKETSLLVHYGKERTDQMILVRLEEPKAEK